MHLSLPPSLVDIADSRIIAVIAWNINIIMNMEIIIAFIIASRAYLLHISGTWKGVFY